MAEQLKRTFGNMQAFLARYGGDEFVVIVKGKTQDEMDVIIHQTQENVNAIAGERIPRGSCRSVSAARCGESRESKKAMNCWRLRMSACTARKKVYRTDNPGILSSYVPMGAEDGGLVQ